MAIGNDMHGYGDPIPVRDPVMGNVIDWRKPLTVWCEFCGIFDVRLDTRDKIVSCTHLTDNVTIQRAIRRLPDTAQHLYGLAVPA